MTTLFRVVFAKLLGWQSPKPWVGEESYEGLVELARRLYVTIPSTSERSEMVGELLGAFPRQPQLLRENKLSAELLGLLTCRLFPFLVGPCTVKSWERAPGESWRSDVQIERCKFLEVSGCKGMCLGLCKAPTEAFFGSIGLPVSLSPDFEDGSCSLCWGRTPCDEDLADQDLRCFRGCGLVSAEPASLAKPLTVQAPRAPPTSERHEMNFGRERRGCP